jgi:hypothetical protein
MNVVSYYFNSLVRDWKRYIYRVLKWGFINF